MAAHLREVLAPRCVVCGKPAQWTLHTAQNERVADYCNTHGHKALGSMLASDESSRSNAT